MGGLQRVNTIIANELSLENPSIYLYSLQKYKPFYSISENVTMYYGEKNYFEHLFVLCLKALKKLMKNFFGINILLSEEYQVNKLSDFIKKNKVDTIILNSPSIMYSTKLRKVHPNVNIILWMHNNAKTYITDYFKGKREELVNSMMAADKVVSLTQSDFIEYSKLSSNIQIINNPLTISSSDIKSNLTNKVISVVGRLDIEHKGLDYLVSLGDSLPKNWSIEIAGDGNKESIKRLQRMIKESYMEDKIILKGSLSGKQLEGHYINSSIYLMTSRWEGMPLVLAEAMNFGLPIIAFRQTGSVEVLDNGKYGILVENGNLEEMKKQLLSVINSYSLRKKYQDLSIKRVEDFKLSENIIKWKEIL